MIERFTESRPVESKEAATKGLEVEMLERFRARFKRGERVEHFEESISSPEPVAIEEVNIVAKEEEQEVAATKTEARPTKKSGIKKQIKALLSLL